MTPTTTTPTTTSPADASGSALDALQTELERMRGRMDELLQDAERHWRAERLLHAACDASREALAEPDPKRACNAALAFLGEALEADLLELHLRVPGEDGAIVFQPCSSWSDPARTATLGSLAWAVYDQPGWLRELDQNRHVAARTDRAPPDFRNAIDADAHASFFVVPVRYAGENVGALLGASRKLERTWSNQDETAMTTVAAACGAALARLD